eukprot:gene5489-5482_t
MYNSFDAPFISDPYGGSAYAEGGAWQTGPGSTSYPLTQDAAGSQPVQDRAEPVPRCLPRRSE